MSRAGDDLDADIDRWHGVLVGLMHLLAALVDVLVVVPLRLRVRLGPRVRHVVQEGIKLGQKPPVH